MGVAAGGVGVEDMVVVVVVTEEVAEEVAAAMVRITFCLQCIDPSS